MADVKEDMSAGAQTSIDDLPDEILTIILKKLSCTEIVTNVYHVCHRWRSLAALRPIWVRTEVKVKDVRNRRALFKILEVAPCLHTLDFSKTSIEEKTAETLLRSSTRIRFLKFYHCTTSLKALPIMIDVLHKFAGSLQGLTIELSDLLLSACLTEKFLEELPELQELTLVGQVNSERNLMKFVPNCPRLKSLNLTQFEVRTYNYTDSRRYKFVCDCIRSVKESLKMLHLPEYCHDVTLNSAVSCRSLSTISLSLEYVSIVSSLPLIETMIIYCNPSDNPPKRWTRPKNLRSLELILRQPNKASKDFLRNIEADQVSISSDTLCRELEHFYSPSIKRLTLRCFYLRLRHLKILEYRTILSKIEYLDVRGCFLGNGVPHKVLTSLKRSLPSLEIHSDKFISYSKVRSRRNDVECSLGESTDCSDTE